MYFRKPHWQPVALALTLALGIGIASAATFRSPNRLGLLSETERQALHLDAQQTAQLDHIQNRAVENQRRIREQMAATRTLLDAELTKPEPDLRRIVTDARTRFDAVCAQIQANMDNRLAFYESLSIEQKQIVRTGLQQRLERLDRLHGMALNLLIPVD